ncbi:hypothetical protein KEM52_006510 [Ascosphaera acerosa]|nr:hypothetical protein KEM52_006510 [Ascosphaera acerosa]
MAANDYYNSFNAPGERHAGLSTPSPSAYHGGPADLYPSAGSSGHSYGDHDYVDADRYADNIPLKSAQSPDPREVIPPPVDAAGRPLPPPPDSSAGADRDGMGGYASMNTQYMPAPPLPPQPPPVAMRGPPPQQGGFFSFKRKTPWFVYLVTTIQLIVFIVELVKSSKLTGSPVMVHPQFSPMIGPSPYVQIHMGARFVPCMRNEHTVQDVADPPPWPCPNVTSNDPTDPGYQCTLSELCGMTGVPNPKGGGTLDDKPAPNQWYRFITPIFLHAGFIHIGFNFLTQLSMGIDKERQIGSVRFALIYLASGVFGFILGGNFAAPMIASTGCSGSLFGIIALDLLDLFYNWRSRRSPWCELLVHLITIAISFALGLLPGLDNYSHIGGFAVGLVLGVVLLHSPDTLRQRLTDPKAPYEPMHYPGSAGPPPLMNDASRRPGFLKRPLEFFKGRRFMWWMWWLFRAAMLLLTVIAFALLLNNFYRNRSECSWCKYLSCIPVKNWCDLGAMPATTTTVASPSGSVDPSGALQTGSVNVSPNKRALLSALGSPTFTI